VAELVSERAYRNLTGYGASHRNLDPSEGLQDAQLDTGARVHIVHGDIARGGHLMVNIRKFVGPVFVLPDVPIAPAATR